MSDSSTCLFIGRFQPFHNGHLMVIKGMVKVCRKIVIAIGSSQEELTKENPFSAEERKEMIQRALQDADIIPAYDVYLVEVPDMDNDKDWAKKVLETAEDADVIWTGNEDTKACFEGIEGVRIQEIKEVPGISATEVRERIKNDGDWKSMIAPAVAGYIQEINGVERVKKLG